MPRNDSTVGIPVVYFIQAGEVGSIKIGYSRTGVKQRLVDHQVSCPHRLRILGYIADSDACQKESDLHEQFRSLRTSGEWFLPQPELLKFIADNATPWPKDDDVPVRPSQRQPKSNDTRRRRIRTGRCNIEKPNERQMANRRFETWLLMAEGFCSPVTGRNVRYPIEEIAEIFGVESKAVSAGIEAMRKAREIIRQELREVADTCRTRS